MAIVLKDYQEECKELIQEYKHCILQMQTGTGKTFTALDSVDGELLVICPNKASKVQWEKSVVDIDYKDQVTVFTYHELKKYPLPHHNFKSLIFDECHNIINNSKRTKATFKKLFKLDLKYNVAMSYTPIKKSEQDLYMIQKNLSMKTPLKNKYYTLKQFQTDFFLWKKQWNYFMNRPEMMPYQFKNDRFDELCKLSNVINYVDNDRFNYNKYAIMLTKPKMEIYNYVNKTNVLPEYYQTLTAAVKLIILHQISNSTVKYDEDDQRLLDDDYLIKIQAIRQIVNKFEKVIVVYNFKSDASLIENALRDEFEIVYDENKFKSSGNILLRQASRSSAIDIPWAQCMVWYSMNYSGVDFEQMHGRIARMNSEYDDMYYYYLVFGNTIEKRIYDVAQGKISKNQMISELEF